MVTPIFFRKTTKVARFGFADSFRHLFLLQAFCAPHTKGNTCSVVNGATAILLDTRSSNIQDIVYDAITHGLNDTDMLQAFSPFVVGAQFQIALGETLLAAPTYTENASPGPITAAVAVAAASVSFVVASIFCYGLMRRQMRHHPEPSVRYKFRRRKMGHPTMGLKPPRRRRRFIRLDELSHPSDEEDDDDYDEEEVEDYSPHHHPSITWSISDITSDSASCMSGMSCTTSRLERIEEEEEEDDNCEGLPTRKRKRGKWRPTSYRSSVECIGLDTISRVEEEVSELAVSQYVSEVPCVRSVTPESVEGSPGDLAVLPAMPEVDDLQISLDDNDDDDIVSLEEPLDPLAIDWQEENEQDEDEMIEASEEISESLLDDIREKVLTIKQVASEAASSHEDKQDAASPDNEAATIMLEKVDWKLDMILPENYEVQDTFPTGAQDGVVDSMGMEIDLTKSEQSFHSPGIEGDIDLEHSKSFCSCEELQSPLPQAKDHVFFTPLQYPPEAICSANANEKVVDMAVQDSSGVCGGSSPQIEVPEEERNESIPMEERTVRSCEADSIECDDDQSIGISRKTV